jgi:hypothetical protein
MTTEYKYDAQARRNYAIVAILSILMFVTFCVMIVPGLFDPETRVYLALRRSPIWIPSFGFLLTLTLMIWNSLTAWNRLKRFATDDISLIVFAPFASSRFLWREIQEIKIAKVPTAINYKVTNQIVIRIFSGRWIVRIVDEISNFNGLVRELDVCATQNNIPLFKTAGVRRWQRTPINSLSDFL